MMTYDELLARSDAPRGSTWGLFGANDDAGTLNLLTRQRVLEAVGLVRRGAVFNLDLPLDAFRPPIGHRTPPRHTIFSRNPNHRDDHLDGFYLQGTSQIDGLRHMRHPVHGFYNGAADELVEVGAPTLGIQRWAERGIVGRGVLLDVAGYLQAERRPLDPSTSDAFGVADLEGAARRQGVRVEPGSIVLVRTGWVRYVLEEMPDTERARLAERHCSVGLEQSEDVVRWLWDHQVAMLAADNLAVEALPVAADSPFVVDGERVDPATPQVGMMHRWLIPMLGLALGELWWLEDLATDCVEDSVWEFLLVAKPLNLVGGVGSPANATAIK